MSKCFWMIFRFVKLIVATGFWGIFVRDAPGGSCVRGGRGGKAVFVFDGALAGGGFAAT